MLSLKLTQIACYHPDDSGIKHPPIHAHTYMPKMDECHKALFTFQIKKEQPIKSATLPYTRPLPCLCIEVKFLPTLQVLSTYDLFPLTFETHE